MKKKKKSFLRIIEQVHLLEMDRTKLAALGERLKIGGERLKTGGAEFGKKVSGKMKEILQGPSQEAKMVEEATADTLEEANWGLNLRICNLLNSEEFDSSEVVRAIKKKISSNNVMSQRLSLDLLETCAMNCDKVFSAVASEKVLDEMVNVVDNPETLYANRRRAMQLIEAWGKSEDLAYLPVFRHTYMSVKDKKLTSNARDGANSTSAFSAFEPSIDEREDLSDGYFPTTDNEKAAFVYHGGTLSVEEKKEFLVIARNSVEILSSILTAETQEKPVKDDLMLSMVEKCRESEPIIQRVIVSTVDDESLLFEALSLHDEIQQVLSKYQELNLTDPPPPIATVVVDDSFIASLQKGDSATIVSPQKCDSLDATIVSPQKGNSLDEKVKEELKALASENHEVSSEQKNLEKE